VLSSLVFGRSEVLRLCVAVALATLVAVAAACKPTAANPVAPGTSTIEIGSTGAVPGVSTRKPADR
jgi:hypothetical protein